MRNYGQAPFYGTSTRVVLRIILGRQGVARIANILTAAGFAILSMATGFSPSGSGSIDDTVDLPAGSKITYKATGTVSASATGSIVDTATVTSPNGVPDPNTGNNTATDTDTL